jgi:hypothetical protein
MIDAAVSDARRRGNDEVGTMNAEVKKFVFQFIVPRSDFIVHPYLVLPIASASMMTS